MNILTGKKTFTSRRPVDLSNCTKQDIIEYFTNSYDLYESLFLGLKDESVFYKCPDRLRLPLVFYFAHTAAVFVNKLMLAGLAKERVNLPFETIFETGVDEMSWDDTENYRMGGSYNWPSIKEVVEYRRKVRENILQIIEDTPLELPINMESPWWAIMMGIEHERVHLETSAVLIRQLPIRLVSCPPGWRYAPAQADLPAKANKMVSVQTTEVTVGKPEDFPSYGWDNEYGQATFKVPSFEASQYLVTNKEFLQFVTSGGYQCRNLWTDEGWGWVQFRQARHPTFWLCDQGCKSGCGGDLAKETHCSPRPALINGSTNGEEPDCKKAKTGEFKLRLTYDVVDLPLDWPAEVNYHEAKAYCAWKGQGYRMPTEAEQNVMRGQLPASKGVKSDIIFQENIQANLNLQFGSSTPVNMYAASATGHYDTMGNVFEWVEDHFNGLPGFHTHFLYGDFSSPCFDGKHNLIMGGSWISTGSYGSRFARIAFRRHFFQLCGFRLTRSKELEADLPARAVDTEVFILGAGVEENKGRNENIKQKITWAPSANSDYISDTQETLEGILELEFGFRDSLPAAVATFCTNYCRSHNISRESAVHIGSATGRAAFELSKTFEQVLSLEPFGRLIDAAIGLQSGRDVFLKDGKLIQLDPEYKMDRINFKQFTWIANEIDSHDLVLLTHLDRVQNAKAWLIRLWETVNPDGIVAIISKDDTWDKDSLDTLLNNRLNFVSQHHVPFFDAKGKSSASVTLWKRVE